jgi:hypothetical protein
MHCVNINVQGEAIQISVTLKKALQSCEMLGLLRFHKTEMLGLLRFHKTEMLQIVREYFEHDTKNKKKTIDFTIKCQRVTSHLPAIAHLRTKSKPFD